jgi:hypothetical protein
MRIHRDPFEPILPVLEAANPLREYRKIADEILRLMPDEKGHPLNAAISIRSYLLVRFAMQLGIRQRNLRELLLCPRGDKPRSPRQLENLQRGEVRWRNAGNCWEVFIPALAFKNASSSYFKGRPFRVDLANLASMTTSTSIFSDIEGCF